MWSVTTLIDLNWIVRATRKEKEIRHGGNNIFLMEKKWKTQEETVEKQLHMRESRKAQNRAVNTDINCCHTPSRGRVWWKGKVTYNIFKNQDITGDGLMKKGWRSWRKQPSAVKGCNRLDKWEGIPCLDRAQLYGITSSPLVNPHISYNCNNLIAFFEGRNKQAFWKWVLKQNCNN